jgi:hypothetical protein
LSQLSIKKVLQNIDWDFSDYSSSQFPVDINSMHWYPGIFVPHIPSILIETLSSVGDLVLDPFSGAGCTPIEASRLNRRFIGVDRNPYAVKIAQAKLEAISLDTDSWYESEIHDAAVISDNYSYRPATIKSSGH